jgi:hypothetical protein
LANIHGLFKFNNFYMQLPSIILLLIFSFNFPAGNHQPLGIPPYLPQTDFCNELAQILSGMNDNYKTLKGNQAGNKIKYHNSKITLPNTSSNYIMTSYDFNGKPVTNTYYAVLGGKVSKEEQKRLIGNITGFMDKCPLPGFTKKVDEGIMQFTDDPEQTAGATQSIHWINKADNKEIALTYYYDVIHSTDKVGVVFKSPYQAVEETQKSASSHIPSKFTIINLRNEAVQGFWVDFEGKEVNYFNLKPKEQIIMDSYTNHIWRIKSAVTNNIIKTVTLVKGVEVLELK